MHFEHNHGKRLQRGYLLLEVLLVLGILGLMIPMFFVIQESVQERDRSSEIGDYLAQVTSAVQAYMGNQGANTLTTLGCAPGAFCIQNGTNWLKDSATCPAATVAAITTAYIPCGYPDTFANRNIQTYLFLDGGQYYAVLYAGAFVDRNNPAQPRRDLAARAASAANARQPTALTLVGANPGTPVGGGFLRHYVFDPLVQAWTHDAATEAPIPLAGELVAETNTAPGLDVWLRVDGSNAMEADLDAGGFDLVNVNGIRGGCTPAEDADGDGLRDADGFDCSLIPVDAEDFILNSVGQRASEGVYDIFPGQHNDIIDKPLCPAGTFQAIYTPISEAAYVGSAGGSADAIHGFSAYALDCGVAPACGGGADRFTDGACCDGGVAGQWQLKIRGVTAGSPPESLDQNDPAVGHQAVATAIVKCETL